MRFHDNSRPSPVVRQSGRNRAQRSCRRSEVARDKPALCEIQLDPLTSSFVMSAVGPQIVKLCRLRGG